MFDRLGDSLLLLRLLWRLSQSELAERAGIRPNQISRYETGAVQPQLAQLERLLSALRISLPELVFVLGAVERIASLLADADQRQPAEVVAADAAIRYWGDVVERHVAIAAQVTDFVQQLGGGDV